jgi:hypothetical protein
VFGFALWFIAGMPAADVAPRHKAYPELMAIVDAARAAPPEFAADALLQVAQYPRLADTEWKRELAEEAFQSATLARIPMGQKVFVGPVGKHSSRALLGLDRLSLQQRAVKVMLRIDPRRARELFEAMPKPVPRRLTCSETLLDEPSPYYDLLAEIINATYTPGERRQERHLGPALAAASGITSPVEVAPVAGLIPKLHLTAAQRELLATQFSSALGRIEGDDRAFGSSLFRIDAAMKELIGRCGESAVILRAAYRKFLVANFKGPRCAEDFNSKLPIAKLLDEIAARERFTEEERKSGELAGAAEIKPFYDDAEARRFQQGFKKLIFTPEAQRTGPAWRDKLDEYVRALENWTVAAGQSETELFRLKGGFLAWVTLVLPPGPERDQAVGTAVGYFKNSPAQGEDWVEWFGEVRGLVSIMHAMEPAEGAKFLVALEASGHPVLALYAKVERSLSGQPPRRASESR